MSYNISYNLFIIYTHAYMFEVYKHEQTLLNLFFVKKTLDGFFHDLWKKKLQVKSWALIKCQTTFPWLYRRLTISATSWSDARKTQSWDYCRHCESLCPVARTAWCWSGPSFWCCWNLICYSIACFLRCMSKLTCFVMNEISTKIIFNFRKQ